MQRERHGAIEMRPGEGTSFGRTRVEHRHVADGVRPADVYRAALDRIRTDAPRLTTDLGKRAAAVLLGPRGIEAWQFHHVGLDDAEGVPEVLRTGMVVAYELMFAVDDQGFYLEDMILIEPDGHRMLTPGLPYTAGQIEAAIRPR